MSEIMHYNDITLVAMFIQTATHAFKIAKLLPLYQLFGEVRLIIILRIESGDGKISELYNRELGMIIKLYIPMHFY